MPSAASVEVREAESKVWEFFQYEVSDATPLDSDPFDTAWEAVVDGEVVGMLAVEFFAKPHLVRLAVREDFRRRGVATTLLERAMEERDEWYAYVDEDNESCQSLLSGLGFESGGYAPPPNLEQWSWEDGDGE